MGRYPDKVQDPCRTGHYCPRGDINPYPVPCPNGTFNAQTGLEKVSECQACTAGDYCTPEGLSATAGPCPGGYYCPQGTAESTTFPCPIGFYRNGSARESFQDCAQCIAGFYCNSEGLAEPVSCPEGYFCVSGSTYPQPCPLGTYSNSTELRRSTDCAPCPGGKYCAGLGETSPTGICDPGFYCREKAYTSAPPDGLTGGVCPIGGYCPAGSAVSSPCDPGYYSPSLGAKTSYDCVPCEPGKFCSGTSSGGATANCAAGYYCIGGASTAVQYDTEPGHYSAPGAFKQEPCAKGTYQRAYRSSSCETCIQGYYCNGTGTVDPIICPAGFYCPESTDVPFTCPRGTYQPDVARYDITHCNPCTPGYGCDTTGLSAVVNKCAAGFYCLAGSNTTHPTDPTIGGLCPVGYYCELGTADYSTSPCKNGTYSNSTGNTAIGDCTSCDPGRVCNGYALQEPNGYCAAGYYCRGGAKTDMPNDGGTTGSQCLEGHYCPIGTGQYNICILVHKH